MVLEKNRKKDGTEIGVFRGGKGDQRGLFGSSKWRDREKEKQERGLEVRHRRKRGEVYQTRGKELGKKIVFRV